MVTEGNSTSSKKRKYADSSNSSRSRPGPSAAGASFAVSEDSARNGLKPLVVSTPSIALTDDVEFTLYESSAVPANGKESGKRDKGKGRAVHSMLHGDSAKLEWTSSNRMASESVPWRTSEEHVLNGQDIADNTAEEASASYALALYDPSSSTISLIDAPLHILSHIPKRLKNLPPISSRDPATNNAQARTDLGMTFGTKKSQKAIKAAERNRVDAGAQDLQVLQDVMQQGLEEGLTTLPASSQIAGRPKPGGSPNEESSTGAVVEAARLSGRPVPNIAADSPEDVYNVIGNIILTKEVQAIDAHSLIRLSIAEKERGCAMLPFKRSTWVNDRVKEVIANLGGKFKDKERLHKLKILIWISALMNMRTYSKGGLNPLDAAVLEKQFGRLIGLEAVQSLIERFAEDQRGSKKRQITPAADTRILSYLFLACLHYESYSNLDFGTLNNDLGGLGKRVAELIKMLGCRIIIPRGKDLDSIQAKWRVEGRTLPDTDQGKLKVASLLLPLEFPKEKRGKATGR